MTRRAILLAVTAWLAVVLIGAELTWLVVGDAGRRVSSVTEAPSGSVPRADGVAPLPSVGLTSPPTARPKHQPDKARRSPAEAPTTPRASSPATSPRPAKSAGSSSPSPETHTETRTWRGEPGTVTASCRGSRISLRSASPADGWRVEPESSGPEEAEVKFESGEREVKVRAECSRGVPRFSSDTG